jgi:hypothetical protein
MTNKGPVGFLASQRRSMGLNKGSPLPQGFNFILKVAKGIGSLITVGVVRATVDGLIFVALIVGRGSMVGGRGRFVSGGMVRCRGRFVGRCRCMVGCRCRFISGGRDMIGCWGRFVSRGRVIRSRPVWGRGSPVWGRGRPVWGRGTVS